MGLGNVVCGRQNYQWKNRKQRLDYALKTFQVVCLKWGSVVSVDSGSIELVVTSWGMGVKFLHI